MFELTVSDARGNVILETPLFQEHEATNRTVTVAVPESKCVDRLIVSTRIPILDVQGYWHPRLSRPRLTLDWRIDLDTAPHKDFPFITFFNQLHQNRFAIGLAGLTEVAELRARQDQSTCSYQIEFTLAVGRERKPFQVFADRTEGPWTDAVARYRSVALPDLSPTFPEAAWEPVFCTWYARHAAVNAEWIEANARPAAEMGFGTLIVDDGWCIDADKKVSPETLKTWYANAGEWEVCARKFPDMAEHVKRVREMGLKYLLWVAPLMLGVGSRAFAEHHGACFEKETEGYRMLDPANEAVCAEIVRNMSDLVARYGLDGLKVDFLDDIPASIAGPRGEAMMRFMRQLAEAVRAIRPDALIEYRQRYAGPVVLPWATQFRAGDVPFDFLDNLRRIGQVRLCVGDRVPVHADPAFWHPDETPENIARHLICALAGVPMVSVDLAAMPESTRRMIRNWLAFYRRHINTFRAGAWTVNYVHTQLSSIVCRGANETVAVLQDAGDLDRALDQSGGKVWVLNASCESLHGPFHQAFDHRHESVPSDAIPAAGLGVMEKS